MIRPPLPLLRQRCTLALALLLPMSASAEKGDKVHGQQIFHDKGCTHCHGEDRRGTDKGPDLADLHKKLSAAKMRDQIVNGGQGMPPFGDVLAEQEIQDLIAYLRSKPAPSAPHPATPAAASLR